MRSSLLNDRDGVPKLKWDLPHPYPQKSPVPMSIRFDTTKKPFKINDLRHQFSRQKV
jgi:hypothetical protein